MYVLASSFERGVVMRGGHRVIQQKTYQSPSKEHHAMTANHSIDPAGYPGP